MNLNVLEEKNYIISVLHDLNAGGDQIISIPGLITFSDLPCKIYINRFKFQDKNLPIPAISGVFDETVEREFQKFFIIATDASKNHQITSIAGCTVWKHLTILFTSHKESKSHLNSTVASITRSSLIGILDVDLKEHVECEAEYCVKILRRIVATIKLLASQRLAFCGSIDAITSRHKGIY
ncbi:hypothetical protein TNCV_3568241 [Trichonephila clavipes]|nr:hypothetical protein TNCV_3568241 [Trichonephila clavipes]